MNDKLQKIEEVQTFALVDPQALISQAITAGTPIEGMERLMAMRRELRQEFARDRFFSDLALFQKECQVIQKKEKVDFTGKKSGVRVNYSYAPLDVIVQQVREPLEKYGFSYIIKTRQTDKDFTAICEAHHRDGHVEVTEFTVPIDRDAYMNDSQKVGSANSYAKRYAFCNAFGILTGDADDDANATGLRPGSKPEPRPAAKPAPKKSPARLAFEKLFREYVSAKCDGDKKRMAVMFRKLSGKNKLDDLTNDELDKVRKAILPSLKEFEAATRKAAA